MATAAPRRGLRAWWRHALAFCLLLAGVLFFVFSGRPRPPQCTAAQEASLLGASLVALARCNDDALLLGPAAHCEPPPPPACSRKLAGDAVTLAYGMKQRPPVAVDPYPLASPLACQQQLGRAAASYVPERLRHRIAGRSAEEADALARAEVDAIAGACDVTVGADVASGIVLPDVGPQCDAAVGPPGAPVDAAALRDCVHDLLEVWVERIGPDPAPLRPNVIVIMTDDQRWDTLDGTQAPPGQVVMPSVMAQIASRGVRFDAAFVPSPLCAPSRTSFLTGQYAHHHGVKHDTKDENHEFIFDPSSSIATWLQAAGYRTGIFGKYQLGPAWLIPPGWDHWCVFSSYGLYDYGLVENGVQSSYGSAETDYSTDVLRDKALAFLEDAAARGGPFFLVYTPIAPHAPVVPAARHQTVFAGLAPFRPPNLNEADVSDKPTHLAKNLVSLTDIDAVRLGQLRMLQSVDEAVAALMQRLRELGLERDTLVVYYGDNGLFWGEHRLSGKEMPYEEAIRVPMLVRYPRLAPLPRSDGRLVVLNLDLPRTLAELAGATPGPHQDGRSLVSVLDGTAAGWRADFLAEGWPVYFPAWAAVREERWKYVEWATGETELYDLAVDPFELQSLHAAPQHAARVSGMALRLRALRPMWPQDLAP